jgi:YaiO family outer membrane protein
MPEMTETPDRVGTTIGRGAALRLSACLVVAAALLSGRTAAAQDDIITRARTASSAGQRPQALAMLEGHLANAPSDVDVRLTYGLILSWDGRYDEARAELQRVLVQAPAYVDARVALMNVEWWSGRPHAASDLAAQILSREPGNPQARLMRQRLEALSRPWKVTTWYAFDTFNDGNAWQEFATSVGRETPAGSVIVRGTNAQRFGYTDQLIEVEAYPSLRAGTYAYVGIGAGVQRDLYPVHRLSFDLYQSVGHGLEISGGYRRLKFSEPVSIYLGTATKYVGTWSLTGRVFFVPSEPSDSWSFHGESRRYFGSAGTSFVGGTFSHGFNRDEPRGLGDTILLHSNTVRGQADIAVSPRSRLLITVSTSRQERPLRIPLWQTSVSAGAAYGF